MEIKNLNNFPPNKMIESFIKSYADYFLPIENASSLIDRWQMAGVDFSVSYGAFVEGELVAFMLQIPIENRFHIFATGVVPCYRGRNLLKTLFEFGNVKHHCPIYSLEVLKDNEKACTIYKKLGFKIHRELNSYQGRLTLPNNLNSELKYEIKSLDFMDNLTLNLSARPAVENSLPILLKNSYLHEVHLLQRDRKVIAYALFTPYSLSIRQIGSLYPMEENLDQLFLHMKLNNEELTIINIDSGDELNFYFERKGFRRIARQYEMKRTAPYFTQVPR